MFSTHVLRAFATVAGVVVLTARPVPAQAPTAGSSPVKGVTVEGITEYRLTNGLRVLLFPDKSKPQTTVNVTYLVGSRHEGYGETGMAHLLEHMLFKGTPKHRHPSDEITAHGASFDATTSFDRTNFFETFTAADSNLVWALDIAEVDADELEIRNIPVGLVRRDPERHIVFRRERAQARLWQDVNFRGTGLNIWLDDLATYGPEAAIFVVPDRNPRREQIRAAVRILIDRGIADST